MRKKIAATFAAAALLTLAAGCSEFNDDRGVGDAPVGAKNDGSAEVVNFPDTFMNVASKCDHGHRIYTHTRQGPPVIVENDSSCPQS